ncbi:MAG: hypothetical protein A3G49_06800 [Candidatus Sungbacteria bacterium RIFCSPLOWO2_12_FULL_41_11]|uniref:Uncharacterized protein n=1 Tax=Candidatus Sungbacteria bacterium RIFCSPLOWO2_12_FULL_41_11 TaxID=1802286 RepID=A0A1G2LPC4_9BACT|nr:MAG: hypothetical protein A3D41_01800 [Candidatus Sungbacteria bacterium RIFCSPHIGHO2_02_FULL_41_12b]OHA13480.1 MAG: hypothetical protein A3G49_06800 [Candidatus Sungbacteria bacterium RIFCSPLOWO2_12_FULL_41_11]
MFLMPYDENMNTLTIPKELIKEKELIIIPRKKYEEFMNLQKMVKKWFVEEVDTDKAIKIYKKEKRQGKLKTINSLAELR